MFSFNLPNFFLFNILIVMLVLCPTKYVGLNVNDVREIWPSAKKIGYKKMNALAQMCMFKLLKKKKSPISMLFLPNVGGDI